MKRALMVVLLGLSAGTLAHFGWYELRRPTGAEDFVLPWMKTHLALDAAQYERLIAVHEHVRPQLAELAAEVEKLRVALAEFEARRRSSGEVDFLRYAAFLQRQRDVEHDCARTTQHLVAATADIMTPEQRTRYFELLGQARSATGDESVE